MPRRRNIGRLIAAAAALAVLYALLVQPNAPGGYTAGALLRFPLELPVIILLLLAAPRRVAVPLRAVLTLLLVAMWALKLADLGAMAAYARPFNPALDGELIPAAFRLLKGTVGWPMAVAATVAVALALALLAWLAWWATGAIARLAPARGRGWVAALLLPALVLAGLDLAPPALRPFDPPGTALTTRLAWEHARDGWRGRAELARFRLAAADDARAALPPEDILPALRGTDVFVVFVESYGRSALENPLYAPTVTAALDADAAEIKAAGLAARSGFLTAPMVGGQSWLAHASLLSGLSIDDQARYRALLASPRRTLLHLAQAAGWRTAAVMPAITLAWPEAAWFGYDRVLAAADLGYRGKPFNWVTMPDQFTLASVERQLLGPGPRAQVFAEIALISSHAPWTPIPPLLPWDALGDGRGFDAFATAGDPPDVVWRDPDRIREQYRRSLDYVLRVLGGFAARRAPHPTLMILLGDHQPAAFVSGDAVNRDVPVHLIGTPATLARIDAWGWTPGLVPAPAVPAWPMAAFRDRFLDAFGPGPAPQAALRIPAGR